VEADATHRVSARVRLRHATTSRVNVSLARSVTSM
jgi:hypothetical protein